MVTHREEHHLLQAPSMYVVTQMSTHAKHSYTHKYPYNIKKYLNENINRKKASI